MRLRLRWMALLTGLLVLASSFAAQAQVQKGLPGLLLTATAESLSGQVQPGTENQPVLRIDLQVPGTQTVSEFIFDIPGAMSVLEANLGQAKVYYTGASNRFATDRLFGSVQNDRFGPIGHPRRSRFGSRKPRVLAHL